MTGKLIALPRRRRRLPPEGPIRSPWTPKAIIAWPAGLAAAPTFYPMGNSDEETNAIIEALEKVLKG